MTKIKIGKDHCPTCKKILDAAIVLKEGTTPSPKDVTVCIGCGELLMFSDDMSLIKLPDMILDTLSPDVKAQLLYSQRIIIQTRIKQN